MFSLGEWVTGEDESIAPKGNFMLKVKFAVFTTMLPAWTTEEAIRKLAVMGYDGIELRVAPVGNSPTTGSSIGHVNLCTLNLDHLTAEAKALQPICRSNGIAVASLASYLPVTQLDRMEEVFEAARILHCPLVRVNAAGYSASPLSEAEYQRRVNHFAKVVELARQYEVKAGIELRCSGCAPTESLGYRLATNFDPRFVGLIYEPGYLPFGGGQEYHEGLELLGPYLAQVRCKNIQWRLDEEAESGVIDYYPLSAPIHHGLVNWRKILAALRALDYRGWISIEDFSLWAGTEEKVRHNLVYMQNMKQLVEGLSFEESLSRDVGRG